MTCGCWSRPTSAPNWRRRCASSTCRKSRMDPVPRRSYPQGHVAGADSRLRRRRPARLLRRRGALQRSTGGQGDRRRESTIPFDVPIVDWQQDRGRDIVLTIDRDVQYIAESELLDDINTYDATGGSIIVMNPRNGDILAMANYPSYDPNDYCQHHRRKPVCRRRDCRSVRAGIDLQGADDGGGAGNGHDHAGLGLQRHRRDQRRRRDDLQLGSRGARLHDGDASAGRIAQRRHGDHQHENGSDRFLHDDGQIRHRPADRHRPRRRAGGHDVHPRRRKLEREPAGDERLRAGRRRDAAPDGHGGRRDRQWRLDDAAARDPSGDRRRSGDRARVRQISVVRSRRRRRAKSRR